MSDNQSSNNRAVVYLLGVIILLLVVLLVIVFARQQPAATVATNPGTQTAIGATGTAMPGVAPSTGVFDKATATKVPAGQTPTAYVTAYYANILAKKWDVAFKMQPATSQQGGTVDEFAQSQQMFGMKSFKVISDKVSGDTATVLVQQDLGANGTWGATWTFVKDGSTWLVKERLVQMGASQ